MRKWLEEARGRKYVGVAELAQEAARILRESGTAQQARGTVTELPDERTVRYYLAEGLVAPTGEKHGPASVFGYRQLLQLLSVKKLQAEHLPIRTIRELVAAKTERQLEKLLVADEERGAGPAGKGEALRYLESLLKRGGTAPTTPPTTPPPQHTFAPPAPPRPPSASAPRAAMRGAASTASPPQRETWARVELEPGLEVHVSDGYDAPHDRRSLRRLALSFLNVLKARGGRTPGRGGR